MRPAPLFEDIEGVPGGGKAYFVTAEDGTDIRVAFWDEGHSRTALIFPGRTEYIEKYGRFITKLRQRSFNVVVIDWRGQGLADRLDGTTDRGHVEDFLHFQQDIDAALAIPEIAALSSDYYIFAHSMGGAIAYRALLNGLDVKAAILSAPMFGITGSPMFRPILDAVGNLGEPFGLHKSLVPGATMEFYVNRQAFEGNRLTSDPVHFSQFKSQLAAHPELGLGGPTVRWASEASKEMAALEKEPLPDIPLLIMFGSEEQVVDLEKVRKKVAGFDHAEFTAFEGGRHELWMETDKIQTLVWERMDGFLARQTQTALA